MKKINVFGLEIGLCEIVKGAVIAAGGITIAVGIKKLFDSKEASEELVDLEDDDPEFDEILLEEYKDELRYRYTKEKIGGLISGIAGIAVGALTVALGILSFTPARKIVTENKKLKDFKKNLVKSQIKNKLAKIEIKEKLADIDLQKKLAELRNFEFDDSKLKDIIADMNLREKLADIDLKNKIAALQDRF